MDADRLNWLAQVALDYAYLIHTDLGPGMREEIYCDILADCLRERGLIVEEQKRIPVVYRGKTYRRALRADLVVEGELVLEIKCVDRIDSAHIKQLVTYLTMMKSRLGLLLNFGALSLKNGIKRVANGL